MPVVDEPVLPGQPDPETGAEGWSDRAEVVAELTKVLESPPFAGAWRSRAFLAYVVTETLAGRGQRLSERTVGRYALGRHDRFDGRVDSSVRVQATRVRRGLHRYYATEGEPDQVRIDLPAGTYVPTFSRSEVSVAAARAEQGPLVAVLRFDASGKAQADVIAAAVCEAIVRLLSGFPGLGVIGPAAATSADPRAIAARLGARFVLQGSVVVQDDQVRLAARLVDGASEEVIWAVTDTCDEAEFRGFRAEDHWSQQIAGEIGDFTGIVLRRERRSPVEVADPRGYAAKLAFYAYVERSTRESITAAALALDAALEVDREPVLLAMRGAIHNADAAHGSSQSVEQDLAAAVLLAREALELDPRSAQAHLVLGTTAWLRQEWELAHHQAAAAVRLSPAHPSVLMTAGLLTSVSGDWSTGLAWMRDGFRLNSSHPGHAHALPALACLIAGDDAEALAEASLVHAPGQVWGPLYRAMALAGLGYVEQARTEMEEVLVIDPHFLDDPAEFFRSGMNCTEDQLGVILAHLEPWVATAELPRSRGQGETRAQ